MSSSDSSEFRSWLEDRFASTQGFTALLLLLAMKNDRVDMLSCSYVHVIGDETTWADMKSMLDASGRKWDAVAMFAESPPGGGPLVEFVARARLQERIDQVTADRMVLNDAGFFDRRGRAIRIDPVRAN